MKILFVNASVRPNSRTKRIANYLLDRISAEGVNKEVNIKIKTINLGIVSNK